MLLLRIFTKSAHSACYFVPQIAKW